MRIGIFGGSFNPPHKMHKNIPEQLIKNNYLDKVIFVPAGNKYNKPGLVKDIDRFNMIKLMIEDNKNLDVSNYEFTNEFTYTYLTLDYFKNMYNDDEIYFICGTDNLNQFDSWKNFEYILEKNKILVIKRNNDNVGEIIKKYSKYQDNIIIANIEMDNISSTRVRENIKNNNLDLVKQDLDEKVIKYIKENNLY